MKAQYTLSVLAVTALLFLSVSEAAPAEEAAMKAEMIETSTESPIADISAIIDLDLKTSTERPPTAESMDKKSDKMPSSPTHTIADFIIHPLVAFKPRNPEEDFSGLGDGKQASSTPAPASSPWQIFSLNAGQTIGSSVSSLTSWLNDRIQLPGFVDTPVRDSTTSTSTSTTTTTPRPDIVVRVQHKASTRRPPLIAINGDNRPNRPVFDSLEEDDDDEDDYDEDDGFVPNRRRGGNKFNGNNGNDDDADDSDDNNDSNNEDNDNESNEETDENNAVEDGDEEEENYSQRPNNRRRPVRRNNRRNNANQNRRRKPVRQGPRLQENYEESDEANDDDDNDDNQSDDEVFYYGSQPSTKRSGQSSTNLIRRGQQRLINHIRQLTRGQSPAEIGEIMRNSNRGTSSKRRQATLFVNRNGQTVYMAPELSLLSSGQSFAQPVAVKVPVSSSGFPQPPLSKPLKRKGEPTQYITIPWTQLGISPPNNLVALTEGIQSQPLILNIPQSAIKTMQSAASTGTRKRPAQQLINADAVPLLAEASLMDIFKPPEIPPSRTGAVSAGSSVASNTRKTATIATISGKRPSSPMKMTPVLLHQHIRPNTVVEKAPANDEMQMSAAQDASEPASSDSPKASANGEKDFIVVGEDNEPGLNRRVEPVAGEARYVRVPNRRRNSAFFEVLQPGRIVWRNGARSLENADQMPVVVPKDESSKPAEEPIKSTQIPEEHIPVAIVEEAQISLPESQLKTTEAEGYAAPHADVQTPAIASDSETASKELPQIVS